MCACVTMCSSFSSPPFKWPKSSPFIVEGRTRIVHVLTIRRRANRGGVSKPYGLFLWRRGCRSGPSLEHWGGVLVPSNPVRRRSPGTASEWVRRWTCKPLWTDCVRGRDLVGVEAAPWWRGLGRHEPQDSRDLGVWCRGLEWAANHGHSVRTQWPVIPAVPCPSRYGVDRGYSVGTQWPVIPAIPYPSRYGADRGYSVRT